MRSARDLWGNDWRGGPAAALIFAALSLTATASAYQVSPLIVDVAPSGRGAAAELRVTNTEQLPLAVEIDVAERHIDAAGLETTEPADADIVALPPQVLIQPGATQVVRLRYVGDPSITSARNYVAVVRQLPIELGASTGRSIAVVVNFAVSLNVVPPSAAANVDIIDLRRRDARSAEVRVRNVGDNYQSLAALRWVFRNGRGQEYAVNGASIRDALGVVLLQAHAERTLSVPLPDGFADDGLRLHVAALERTR